MQEWVNGGVNYGWELLPLGTDGWRWNSSESGTDVLRPTLTVSYVVPEPATLGFIAAMGFLIRRGDISRKRGFPARAFTDLVTSLPKKMHGLKPRATGKRKRGRFALNLPRIFLV